MPSQRAIQALLDLQREKLQNSEEPFALASAYNLNEPNESQRFQLQRQQPEQTDRDSNVSLLQAVGAGIRWCWNRSGLFTRCSYETNS
jgi:hypothetical protein